MLATFSLLRFHSILLPSSPLLLSQLSFLSVSLNFISGHGKELVHFICHYILLLVLNIPKP